MEKTKEAIQDINLKITTDSILFFDMDGTLVETNYANYLSYIKAIQSVLQSENAISYNLGQRFNRRSLRNAIPNLTETTYGKIIKEKENHYKNYLSETKLNKSVANILIQYSKTNRTVLVTNCREDRALMTLNHFGLTEKFSNIFCRQLSDSEEKINKYQKAISYLCISTSCIIAFENDKSEIDDAKIAGISSNNILTL